MKKLKNIMKYLKKYKLFESVNEQEIHDLCKKYDIEYYTINSDGSIDVDSSVDLSDKSLNKIPLKFNKVNGYFNCSSSPNWSSRTNQLKTLDGSPIFVNSFDCSGGTLHSLKGSPKYVVDSFNCSSNYLNNLEGSPIEVSNNFWCVNNQIRNFIGCPEKIGRFYCNKNRVISLDGLLWKSFEYIELKDNPIYTLVKDWINNEDREELIEYFLDLNVIQEGGKPELIIPRLEAFHEEMNLEMNIDFREVKKYYQIIN